MWCKRKPKNRRVERGNVLDVKLRTKQVRAARLRLATTAVGLSLGTVIGLYLVWRAGNWALDQFVFKNDAFAIRGLDIRTDGSIPVEQLRKWAGVKPGDRSEEHTSELQSQSNLVCRLLLETKKTEAPSLDIQRLRLS